MFARVLGENCVPFEVHRGLSSEGAPPPPFVAAAKRHLANRGWAEVASSQTYEGKTDDHDH
jgi:hypothetical protein